MMLALDQAGARQLSVTGKRLYGAVMEPVCSPGSKVAGHYCSLVKIVTQKNGPGAGVTRRGRPIERRVTARDIRDAVDHIWSGRHWSVLNTFSGISVANAQEETLMFDRADLAIPTDH